MACPGEVLTLDFANLDLSKPTAGNKAEALYFQAEFSHTSCPQARENIRPEGIALLPVSEGSVLAELLSAFRPDE